MRAMVLAAAPHALRSVVAGDPLAFHLHLVAWLAIAAVALAYGLGLRHLGGQPGPGTLPTRHQLRCMAGALAALVLALTWPLADLAAHWSLTALVVQRLLLTLAAAPLLLLAMPAPLLAFLTRPAPLDACLEVLTRPVVAVVTFSVVAVGTLLTPAVAAQASSPWWRALTDVALLFGGAVLWGPVLRHIPGTHRTTPVAATAYLFIQSVIPTFPAIIYVFARHPLYEAFINVRVAFGFSRLVDQQLAGVIAKVATLPVLWSAAWVSLLRAQRAEDGAEGDDGEPLTWAEVERQLERAARAQRKGHVREGRRRHAWAGPRPIALPWADPPEPEDGADPADPPGASGPGSPGG
ncbi:MAG TPA: cytochrome c oxidase assembly protein [Acidimicrobiales bacterium]